MKGDRPSIIDGVRYDHQKTLRYGSNDPSITGNVRQAVNAFENQRYKNKIEFIQLIDANGNILQSKRGGRGSVTFSGNLLNQAQVLTHNHPREAGAGLLGGTFSSQDLNNFVKYTAATSRATAAEGTYSISKGANFNSSGFRDYYSREFKKIEDKWTAKAKAYRQSKAASLKQARDNSDWKKYNKISAQLTKYGRSVFNSQLVEMHNTLLAGQKVYGYSYTLERR